MIPKRRVNLRARAVRVGAKSAADFVLFEHLCEQRTAMRTSARACEGEADEVAQTMFRVYDLLLKDGRFFEPAPRPKKFKPGDRHQCYGNSLDLVVARDDLSYCEGFVVVENILIPMEHGWCVTEEGTLVDATLRKPVVPLAYFGVVFNSLFAATRDLPALEAVLIENATPAMWRPWS